MKPEPVPVINGRHASEFIEKVEAPPTSKQREIFREAEEVFRSIKPKEYTF